VIPDANTAAAVELRNVSKRFGSVQANEGVNLRITAGSIHGIIGENGAGKSTAMNLLYGLHRPDSGEIFVNGRRRIWSSPSEAIAAGIGMVHQHFLLAGPHTALDNIILGAEPSRWGFLQRREGRARLETLASQYGLAVALDRPVEELPVGVQQRVEILKLLYRQANILILDEPTAVLTPQETDELFRNLRKLRDEGKTILLITHKLREVLKFSERVTVMGGGKVTGELRTADTNAQELADLMVGRKVNFGLNVAMSPSSAAVVMETHGLGLGTRSGSRPKLSDVNFAVGAVEIVGVAGVEGNGQFELIQALLHPGDPRCRTTGAVNILGQDVSGWPARRIRQLGVAFIPEDRHHEGLLLHRPLLENFALGQQDPSFCRGGFLQWNKLATAANEAFAAFDVRPADLATSARQLSGGNQQKLVVAREFYRRPKLLIAAQPTRGVDVGAIEFIHQQLLQARDSGAGVLLVSSDLDEILKLSDRILVMFEGRMVGEFSRGKVTESELGQRMAGIRKHSTA